MTKKIKHLSSILARYLIGIVIVAWLIKSHQLNLSVILNIDKSTAIIALVLCTLQLMLSAWRVQLLLSTQQISASFWRCNLYNAVGIFYSTVLPGGMSGDAVRAYYFWRCDRTHGATKSALIGALVTDRLIGTLAMLFVGLLAATYSAKALHISNQFLFIFWFGFIVGLIFYILACRMHKYKWKNNKSRFNSHFERLQRILEKLDLSAYPQKTLWLSMIMSLLIHISSVIVIYIFALHLYSHLDFSQIMAISPIGFLVNALPISPGGLGIGEKSFEILFSLVGGQNGGNVFMLSRVFLFSPAILGALGAIYLLMTRQNKKLKCSNEIISSECSEAGISG